MSLAQFTWKVKGRDQEKNGCSALTFPGNNNKWAYGMSQNSTITKIFKIIESKI